MGREEGREGGREGGREEGREDGEEVWECPVHDEEHWVFAPCPASDHHCLYCCLSFLETGSEKEFSGIQVELEQWDEKLREECCQLRELREKSKNQSTRTQSLPVVLRYRPGQISSLIEKYAVK